MMEVKASERPKLKRKHTSRRADFLHAMDKLVPWDSLLEKIDPTYPKPTKKGGRPSFPLPVMLRIFLLQHWFKLSDPAMEDALYDIKVMRAFAGIKRDQQVPSDTAMLRFRHILEKHNLMVQVLWEIDTTLHLHDFSLRIGKMVDPGLHAITSKSHASH